MKHQGRVSVKHKEKLVANEIEGGEKVSGHYFSLYGPSRRMRRIEPSRGGGGRFGRSESFDKSLADVTRLSALFCGLRPPFHGQLFRTILCTAVRQF